MKLKLEQQEVEQLLSDIFANGGLEELYQNSVNYFYNEDNYEKFRDKDASYEENLVNLLKGGGRIKFKDFESGVDTVFLTLELATERLNNMTELNRISEVIEILNPDSMGWDAWTCYNLLQYLLYNEVIFG